MPTFLVLASDTSDPTANLNQPAWFFSIFNLKIADSAGTVFITLIQKAFRARRFSLALIAAAAAAPISELSSLLKQQDRIGQQWMMTETDIPFLQL